MIELSSKGIKELVQYFKQRVEETSPHKHKVWENFVVDINILSPSKLDYWNNPIEPVLVKPSWTNPYPDGGWIRKAYIRKFNFALQCDYIAKYGIHSKNYIYLKPRERSGYYCMPDTEYPKFFSSLFLHSRTKPEKTIATYIYAQLLANSTVRRSARSLAEIKIKELTKRLWTASSSSISRSKIIDVLTASFYEETGPRCISFNSMPLLPEVSQHHMASTKEEFHNEYELISYFADEFVAFSSEYSVFNFNEVNNKEDSMLAAIESYLLEQDNRQKKVSEEMEWSEKKAIERDRKLVEQYPKLSRVGLYTDIKPTIFNKFTNIHTQWKRLDKEDLEKLVWSSPLSTLGDMFGKSDNAVRKWAKQEGIPLPNRGYWNKVAVGKIPYPNGKVDITFAKFD